jgi:hypothetical protein
MTAIKQIKWSFRYSIPLLPYSDLRTNFVNFCCWFNLIWRENKNRVIRNGISKLLLWILIRNEISKLFIVNIIEKILKFFLAILSFSFGWMYSSKFFIEPVKIQIFTMRNLLIFITQRLTSNQSAIDYINIIYIIYIIIIIWCGSGRLRKIL